jgi:transcriptional regulator with XRE-family HTH domain
MGMTQHTFANRFGLPVTTLRHWERGTRNPTGTALVLLHVIRDNPRVVWLAVRKAGIRRAVPALSRAPPGYGDREPTRRPRSKRAPRY